MEATFSLGQGNFYMLSGKISKNKQLVARSLQNINRMISLNWDTHIHTPVCVYMHISIHSNTQKAVQGLIPPLNCDEDGGIHIFSFLLENHTYFFVQRNSFELVKQRKMNLPASASLLCLLMIICTQTYPTYCLEMPPALASSLPFQDPTNPGNRFF